MLPAAVTVDAPHATRSLFGFFWLGICVAALINQLSTRSKRFTKHVLTLMLIIQVVSFSWYTVRFYQIMPEYTARVFRSGLTDFLQTENLILESTELSQELPAVAVIDGSGYHYIHLAWELPVKPSEYFRTVVRQQPNPIGLRYGERLLNVHFIAEAQDASTQEVVVQWNEVEGEWERR